MKKRILCVALCVLLVFGLSSCEISSEEKYYGDYHDGYVDGYNDGVSKAQDSIGGYAEEYFNNINSGNKKDRGITVDDAVQILTNYADGEPISEEELHNAIWSIQKFYCDAWDLIWELDDCVID